jgi:hypothetical protein
MGSLSNFHFAVFDRGVPFAGFFTSELELNGGIQACAFSGMNAPGILDMRVCDC